MKLITSYLRIKEWDTYQHYKDRDAKWLKLYTKTLDSQAWIMSDDPTRTLMLALLMLAAKDGNKVGWHPDLIRQRAHLNQMPDIRPLIAADFLEVVEIEGAPKEAHIIIAPTSKQTTSRQIAERNGFGTRYVPDVAKRSVFNRDGGKCRKCGSTENIEYDHVVPVSKGGNSEESNIQLLCRQCNRKKRVSILEPAEQLATQSAANQCDLRSLEEKREEETREEKNKSKGTCGSVANLPKPKFELPEWIPTEDWRDYEEMRRRIRRPMTDKARLWATKKLAAFMEQGHAPALVLQQSVFNSWQGLFEPRGNGNATHQQQQRISPAEQRQRSIAETNRRVFESLTGSAFDGGDEEAPAVFAGGENSVLGDVGPGSPRTIEGGSATVVRRGEVPPDRR